MRVNDSVLLRTAVLVLGLSMILACGPRSTDSNTNETATATSNESAADSSNANMANANMSDADILNANTSALAVTNANTANANQQASQSGANQGCGDCWAHIYDDRDFDATDDNFMLCGPGKWPNLRNLPRATKINWGDEIESIRVGPKATVTVWTGEQFTGASRVFAPGTQNNNLRTIPGLSDNISSIEITCQ
ncbi:MAG TPA: hypothetical protein VIG62_22590 [Blastocatellia bacterium]